MWDQIHADASLIASARSVLVQLNEAGFEAYLVGGCVRDTVLRKPIHDIDITTSALPAEVMSIFEHTIPTGLQHGTITVGIGGNMFEVTTFREESAYEQYRRPTEVAFIQHLEGDLQRRDFTFNAMALDVEGTLHDPFDGQKDLEERIVRCVGEAEARFQEDALRMLRAIRFAACYDCSMEGMTWHALLSHCGKLQYIAMERVRVELAKMVEHSLPSYVHGMNLLVQSGLLRHTKSDLSELAVGAAHCQRRFELGSTKVCVENWDRSADSITRWALLFLHCDVASATAGMLLQRLKFASRTASEIVKLLQMAEWLTSTVKSGSRDTLYPQWVRATIACGKLTARRLISLLNVDLLFSQRLFAGCQQDGMLVHELQAQGDSWLAALEVSELSDLAIRGQDILKYFKREPGPWLGEVLKQMLYRVAIGAISNTRSAILDDVNRVIHDYE